jgi:hypothetical protein
MSAIDRSIQVRAHVATRVPDDVRVLVHYAPRDRDFRVIRIEEQIIDGVYAVCLSGPLQTLMGKDHSTHTVHRMIEPDAPLPAELEHLVLGDASLRQLLREAGQAR